MTIAARGPQPQSFGWLTCYLPTENNATGCLSQHHKLHIKDWCLFSPQSERNRFVYIQCFSQKCTVPLRANKYPECLSCRIRLFWNIYCLHLLAIFFFSPFIRAVPLLLISFTALYRNMLPTTPLHVIENWIPKIYCFLRYSGILESSSIWARRLTHNGHENDIMTHLFEFPWILMIQIIIILFYFFIACEKSCCCLLAYAYHMTCNFKV